MAKMSEPRCKNCGHMKVAHTANLICPKMELRSDDYDKDRTKWVLLEWLGTRYEAGIEISQAVDKVSCR